MTRRAGASRLLCSLLLFAFFTAGVALFNWDLPEPRSRASKIRVHPRGNLWATGHFMGKKSLEPPGLSLVGTAPPSTQRDQRLQLSHDLLRILLLKKALGMSLSGSASPIQYGTQKGLGKQELLSPVCKPLAVPAADSLHTPTTTEPGSVHMPQGETLLRESLPQSQQTSQEPQMQELQAWAGSPKT